MSLHFLKMSIELTSNDKQLCTSWAYSQLDYLQRHDLERLTTILRGLRNTTTISSDQMEVMGMIILEKWICLFRYMSG